MTTTAADKPSAAPLCRWRLWCLPSGALSARSRTGGARSSRDRCTTAQDSLDRACSTASSQSSSRIAASNTLRSASLLDRDELGSAPTTEPDADCCTSPGPEVHGTSPGSEAHGTSPGPEAHGISPGRDDELSAPCGSIITHRILAGPLIHEKTAASPPNAPRSRFFPERADGERRGLARMGGDHQKSLDLPAGP